MLHTDIPTMSDLTRLLTSRTPGSISIYLETTPIPAQNDGARTAFKDLARTALRQLREAWPGKEKTASIEAIEEHLDDLLSDRDFWQHLSNSLAAFVTPEGIQTYRLPNRLGNAVEVSDRFLVKPLLRSVTFPHSAFVLAISQNAVRLVEVTADAPAFTVDLPDLPVDAVDAVGLDSISGRTADGRIQGSEGLKVRLRQYARAVDQAIRPVLTGRDTPLILAATEPLIGLYRSVNTYAHLLSEVIPGNPDTVSDADLADQARPILDGLYSASLAGVRATYDRLLSLGRTATDLSEVGRAATFGAVDTLLFDFEQSVPGTVDEETGAITLADEDDAHTYGVIDEITRRVLLSGGTVLAVRADDLPSSESPVAAILRFPQAR